MIAEHFDVLVVGAGISGIGAGYHLQQNCPDRSYAILEGRSSLGGTWDLFRYPGVRSDSDMHTLGYSFRPWTDAKSIADGPSILQYVKDTAAEFGIDKQMRFDHQVGAASWSSETSTWTLSVQVGQEGEQQRVEYTCNYLFMCSGYYSYKGGYEPEFPGVDQFAGQVVHPQKWPENLDYKGKRAVVIGSGCHGDDTRSSNGQRCRARHNVAALPHLCGCRAPSTDAVANGLRKVLPDRVAYNITRWKNSTMGEFFYKQTRSKPEKVKGQLLGLIRKELPDEMVG